jgi:hypothetical protein
MKNLEAKDPNKKSQQLINKIRFLKDCKITFQRRKLLKWYFSLLFVIWMTFNLKIQLNAAKFQKSMDWIISFFKCNKKKRFRCKIILKSAIKKCKATLINLNKIWVITFSLKSFKSIIKIANHFWNNQYFKISLLPIKNQIKSNQSLQSSFMVMINQFKITKAHSRNIQFSKLKQAQLVYLQLKFKWKALRSNSTRFQITQGWKSIKFRSSKTAIST